MEGFALGYSWVVQDMLRRGVITGQQATQMLDNAGRVSMTEQTVSGWIKNASGIPNFPYFTAGSATFENPPLETFRCQVATDQTIPDNTETAIDWDTASWDEESMFRWSSDTPERLYLVSEVATVRFLFIGSLQMKPGATGWRAITLKAYDATDTNIFGATLAQLDPVQTAATNTTIPFGYLQGTKALGSGKLAIYFTLNLWHTEGTTLDTDYISMSVHRLV